jgi:predicted RNA-binding protein (virulence factor B family)
MAPSNGKVTTMIEIGKTNRLTAARRAPPGMYLASGDQEVLLPNRFVSEGLEIGAELDVFVYTDSSDRPVATTQKPLAEVGEFACLTVIDVSPHGAFLDWGLDKDLFAPLAEQEGRLHKGDRVVVAVCLDEHTQRVMASSRLGQFLEPPTSPPSPGAPVALLVYRQTELGAQVIVDDRHAGLVYASETFAPLSVGDRVTGYVRRQRDDGKLDVSLRAPGAAGRDDDTRALLQALEASGGRLALHDGSSPEAISAHLRMSKKAFKRAVGNLYRQRLVRLTPDGIQLMTASAQPPERASTAPSPVAPHGRPPSGAAPGTSRREKPGSGSERPPGRPSTRRR